MGKITEKVVKMWKDDKLAIASGVLFGLGIVLCNVDGQRRGLLRGYKAGAEEGVKSTLWELDARCHDAFAMFFDATNGDPTKAIYVPEQKVKFSFKKS